MKLPQTARRVVITGMSAISPLGSSWADVRSALLHNRSGVQHMTEWEDLQGLNTRVGAPAALNSTPNSSPANARAQWDA